MLNGFIMIHHQLRTHLVSVLRGEVDGDFVLWMGIKCATWVQISRPSTGRSYLDPLGFSTKCVKLANMMVTRTLELGCKNEYVVPFCTHAPLLVQECFGGMAGTIFRSCHNLWAAWIFPSWSTPPFSTTMQCPQGHNMHIIFSKCIQFNCLAHHLLDPSFPYSMNRVPRRRSSRPGFGWDIGPILHQRGRCFGETLGQLHTFGGEGWPKNKEIVWGRRIKLKDSAQ